MSTGILKNNIFRSTLVQMMIITLRVIRRGWGDGEYVYIESNRGPSEQWTTPSFKLPWAVAANRVHFGVRSSGDGPTGRLHLGRVGLCPGGLGAVWAGTRQASSRPPHPGTRCVSQTSSAQTSQPSDTATTTGFPAPPPQVSNPSGILLKAMIIAADHL